MQGMSGNETCRIQNPDIPRAGRVGAPGGAAGRGRAGQGGRRQNNSPRRQASLVTPKASKTRLLNDPPEARTSKILCKPNAGTKSAIDKRFASGLSPGREARFLFGCRPVDRCLFVSVNLCHARHVRESCRACPGNKNQSDSQPGYAHETTDPLAPSES